MGRSVRGELRHHAKRFVEGDKHALIATMEKCEAHVGILLIKPRFSARLHGVPKKKSQVEQRLERALHFQKAGQFRQAGDLFRQVLNLHPNQPDALYNLGVIAHGNGKVEEAIQWMIQSLDVNSNNFPALATLGGIFLHRGEWQKSLLCYQKALSLNPQAGQVLANIGTILNIQGRFAEAVPYHEAALKISPNADGVLNNLGAALQQLGRGGESISCYQRAVGLNPKSHLALINLGGALCDQRHLGPAVDCFRKALELKPDCFHTLNSLGSALKELGSFDEALFCFNKARQSPGALQSGLPLDRNLGVTFFASGQCHEAVDCFRRALTLKPDCAETFSNLLFALNHLQQTAPAELFAEHRRFGEQFDSCLEMSPHPNSRDPDRRLRVGFVSGDFRNHAVAHFIEPVFDSIDREKFEIFCYYNYPLNDVVTERFRQKSDSWCNVNRFSDHDLSTRIRNDAIDILVDLSGHSAFNRLLVFARKPAPIQVTMIGYMQTTGLAAMDYRITDETLDPAGISDAFNTEKLIRLPAGAAPFSPPKESPPVNDLPALKNGYVTFASFNKSSKITPAVFAAWAEILKATPESRLLVVDDSGGFVAASLAAHGIAADRLILHPRKPMDEYLALHGEVDFVLDTFPYNGGTTNLIAAWMGIPFVSIEGSSTLARVGACLLRGLGLSELIAVDSVDYVQKAVTAVSQLPRLAEWRSVLRSRFAVNVSHGVVYTRQFEEAFREIWKIWIG